MKHSKSFAFLSLLAILGVGLSVSAEPQDRPVTNTATESLQEKVVQLEDKVERLEALIAKMESQIKDSVYQNVAKNIDTMGTKIENNIYNKVSSNLDAIETEVQARVESQVNEQMSKEIASLEPSAGPQSSPISNVKINMTPMPRIESTDGRFSFQPFGLLQYDAGVFHDKAADHPNGATVRRARLGFQGKVEEDFKYKAEMEFADESVNFTNVYVDYTGFEEANVRVGHFKSPFSLENLTASTNITFIERAAPVTTFATSFELGTMVSQGGETWSGAVALMNDDGGTNSSDDEAWQLSGRGTYTPWKESDKRLVHTGAAAAFRVPDSASEVVRYSAKAENDLQTTNSIDTGAMGITNADNARLYNLELAGVFDSFSAQGEFSHASVNRATMSDLAFSGWYGQVSYFLTGESRPYIANEGKFGAVKPNKPLDPKQDKYGAVEIAGRYSSVDLSDADILGGEMDNYTAGVNWYLNNFARLSANYTLVDTDVNAVSTNDDPSIFLMRAQLDF